MPSSHYPQPLLDALRDALNNDFVVASWPTPVEFDLVALLDAVTNPDLGVDALAAAADETLLHRLQTENMQLRLTLARLVALTGSVSQQLQLNLSETQAVLDDMATELAAAQPAAAATAPASSSAAPGMPLTKRERREAQRQQRIANEEALAAAARQHD